VVGATLSDGFLVITWRLRSASPS